MTTIDEKRVYDDKSGKTQAIVATETGVVVVDVSDDLVGGFALAHRCTARDVAVHGGRIAVATDVDVLEARPDGDVESGADFSTVGYGPAVAVGYDDAGRLLVADEEGTVVARDGGGSPDGADDGTEGEWTELGDAGTVRTVDGPLVASADCVYRVRDRDLDAVGLDDVHDVAGAGGVVPLAATGEGLFRLGNGWLDELDGEFHAVGADGDRALAVGTDGLYATGGGGDGADASDGADAADGDDVAGRDDATGENASDGGWHEVSDLPVDEPVVDVALAADARYAVTEAGTFLLDAGDGWRSQALGLRGIARLTVR